MKIVLVCAAGMSTSLIVQRMRREATNRRLNVEVIAIPMEEFDQQVQDASVVLVGPQVRFKIPQFEKKAKNYGVPVALIHPGDYGTVNGAKILDTALSLIDQR